MVRLSTYFSNNRPDGGPGAAALHHLIINFMNGNHPPVGLAWLAGRATRTGSRRHDPTIPTSTISALFAQSRCFGIQVYGYCVRIWRAVLDSDLPGGKFCIHFVVNQPSTD